MFIVTQRLCLQLGNLWCSSSWHCIMTFIEGWLTAVLQLQEKLDSKFPHTAPNPKQTSVPTENFKPKNRFQEERNVTEV